MIKKILNIFASLCYISEEGKSCPTEILEAIASINAEGRPIWKPMHMQPIYKDNDFITINKVDEDIFARGICLPSDIKMKPEDQDVVIDIIKNACDGFIVGSLFSSGYNYSIDDLNKSTKKWLMKLFN